MATKSATITPDKLAILPEIRAIPAQDTLYHYTRRSGLIGILRNKEVWASNALYLNDARELSTARELALQLLKEYDVAPDSIEARLLRDLSLSFEMVGPSLDVFVFSFSQEDDLLSQWRAYARAGDGYAIGFDTPSVLKIADGVIGYLFKCHYEPNEQKRLVFTVINDAVDKMRASLAAGAEETQARAEGFAAFVFGFQLLSPTIKSKKFEEEKEWRLVLPYLNVWQKPINYRDGGKLLIPYVKVSVAGHLRLISSVRIGPTPHEKLEERATSGLLTVSGFPDAKPKLSAVPFRDW